MKRSFLALLVAVASLLVVLLIPSPRGPEEPVVQEVSAPQSVEPVLKIPSEQPAETPERSSAEVSAASEDDGMAGGIPTADDPLYRRFLLRHAFKAVNTIDDLEHLGLADAIEGCGDANLVFDMLRIALETGEQWAQDYIVQLAQSYGAASEAARALVFTQDTPWAQEACEAMLDQAPDMLKRWTLLFEVADAGLPWGKELFVEAFSNAPPSRRSYLARNMLTEYKHLVGDDHARRQVLDRALRDADPTVIQAAVGFLIDPCHSAHPDGVEWATSLFAEAFDQGNNDSQLALLDGLREELLSLSQPDEHGNYRGVGNISAINTVISRALESNDHDVRQRAEAMLHELERTADTEAVSAALAEDRLYMRSLQRDIRW